MNFKERTNLVKRSLAGLFMDHHVSISTAMDAIRQIDECLEYDSIGFEESKEDLLKMKQGHIERVLFKEKQLLECIRSQESCINQLREALTRAQIKQNQDGTWGEGMIMRGDL